MQKCGNTILSCSSSSGFHGRSHAEPKLLHASPFGELGMRSLRSDPVQGMNTLTLGQVEVSRSCEIGTDESQGLHTKTSRPCKGLGLKARTNAVVGKTNAGSPRDVYQEKCRLVRWRPFRIAHSTSRALLLVENHQGRG